MAYRNVTNRDSAETYPRRQRAAASPIPASNWLRAGHDVSRSSRLSSEYAHEDGRGPLLNNRDVIHTRVSNGYYLETSPMSPYIGGGSIRFMDGEFGAYHVDDSAVSTRDRGLGGGWPESPLLPDASSALFVEGLPTNCTRREASHIFRHFIGYREVRLVTRHQRHSSTCSHCNGCLARLCI